MINALCYGYPRISLEMPTYCPLHVEPVLVLENRDIRFGFDLDHASLPDWLVQVPQRRAELRVGQRLAKLQAGHMETWSDAPLAGVAFRVLD